MTFHCLRHTFATNAISAGMDYYYLSRIMGQTSISVTLDTYTDFMPDKSKIEMKRMEGVLLLNEILMVSIFVSTHILEFIMK